MELISRKKCDLFFGLCNIIVRFLINEISLTNNAKTWKGICYLPVLGEILDGFEQLSESLVLDRLRGGHLALARRGNHPFVSLQNFD